MSIKRHNKIIAAAIIIAGIALWLHAYMLFAAVLTALALTITVGVAVPQICFFVPFIYRGKTTKKQVALTFDDGPDPHSTPQLLALLRERRIPAAFFGIGADVAANPDLAAQIVRDGHLLENHSYTHSHFTNLYLPSRLNREIRHTQLAITKATGTVPRYFRPPNGLTNGFTNDAIVRAGLLPVAWSIRSYDTLIAAPEKILARILARLHPGAIILLHDGDIPAEKLVTTVRLLLDALHERGYEMVRLDMIMDECARG